MPRKRVRARNDPSLLSVSSTSTVASDLNDTGATSVRNWKDHIETEYQRKLEQLRMLENEQIALLEQRKRSLLISLSAEDKKLKINLNDTRLVALLCDICNTSASEADSSVEVKAPATVRRRSRSVVRAAQLVAPSGGRMTRLRSMSANNEFLTPKNRPIVSSMTHNKYTVTKPAKPESSLNLLRMMRPNEKAISTSGSPLFVMPAVSEPTVSIPLKDGMVMKVEANRERPLEVPIMDEKTKQSIQLLIDNLKWLKEAK